MKNRILLIYFISIFILNAGEVDHFLAWKVYLKDASILVNQYFNREITKTLNQLPDNCSCETASSEILKSFGVVLNSPLEKWIKSNNKIEKFPNKKSENINLFKKSIYWKDSNPTIEKSQMISLKIMLDEIININGIYIGVDKITHFTGSGYLYYKRYLSAIKKGNSHKVSMEKAIDLGIIGEKNILGRYASGVFSFADLEANFQGLLFGIELCSSAQPLIMEKNGRWAISRSFNIKNYVNPYWNESYNPSYYYEGKNLTLFPKSITVLSNLSKYCETYKSALIQNRFKKYQNNSTLSFSVKYLISLVNKNEIPNPKLFDIRKICSEVNLN
ncbi:MAG: hypothetical protein HOG33_02615 [Candidatus Marinimicrobia bacterium]|nr:hypothetical protein [Candidatus Neomarinimicrobiota bacterium]